MKTIWGNVIVKNEDRYIWFALKSAISYVDKILIWDTGSSDKTVEIIKLLKKEYPQKIEFKEIGQVNADELVKARQKMLEATQSDWVLVLDGDEVWWENSIKKIQKVLSDNLYAVVNPVTNVVGDIYHFQEENAGKYQILGKVGHLNLRFINRKIPGLHIKGRYPLEGFFDGNGELIQTRDSKLKYVDAPLLHFTHLSRSTSEKNRKLKYEIGNSFNPDFKFPEVFYLDRPSKVPSPWMKMPVKYKVRAIIETPFKKLKRKIR